MGGATAVWRFDRERDVSALQLQSVATAQHMASRLGGYLDVRVGILEQIRRELIAGQLDTNDVFVAEATAFQQRFTGFQAINWIDETGEIQWVAPEGPNRGAKGKNVRNHPVAASAFELAERYGDVEMTPPLQLFQGGTGFATYFPLIREGRLEGYLNGVFRTSDMIEDCFRDELGGYFAFAIADGTTPIYGSLAAAHATATFDAHAEVDVLGRTWQLRIRPTQAYVDAALGSHHYIQMMFMAALAVGLSSAVFLLLERHRRLQVSEAELDRAQVIAQVGHWYWDLRANTLIWSDRTQEIFGMAPGSFPGHFDAFMAAVHPDDRLKVQQAVQAALYEGGDPAIDHRIVLPDGAVRWVHEQGQVDFNDRAEPVYMHGIVQDITERKMNEVILRESEERYRLLADNARDVIWSVNRDGAFTYVSPAITGMLGYMPTELLGTELISLVPESGHETVLALIGEGVAGTRDDARIALQVLAKDRSLVWAEVNATFIRDEDGAFAGFHGITRDIRDAKRAEAILQRRADLEGLLADLSSGFVNCGPEDIDEAITATLGRVSEFLAVERANLVLLDETEERAHLAYSWSAPGLASALAVGMEVAPDNLAWLKQRLKKSGVVMVNSGEDFPPDAQAERARMEASGYSSYTCVALHSGARMLGSFSLATTGPAQTWPEDTLALLRSVGHILVNALERKRTEAVERRLETQLRQAQKMEAVGTLAGGIAHDFNNLLTGILGSLELALMDVQDNEQLADDLRNARTAAQRGADLTRQLLTLSRQQPTQYSATDIADMVQSTVRLLERTLPETIRLNVDIAPNIPPIRADRNQLEQALLNLGINARDAMQSGGELTLRVCRVSLSPYDVERQSNGRPGEFVVIEMTDTGCGIAPDVIERVFEPFFTTKPVGQGTGLGLAMVYGCAEGHEGWVTVDSIQERGTTFRLYLPCVPFGSDVTFEPVNAGLCEAGPAPHDSGTILLVDDSAGVRSTGKRLLERLGYRVILANDGVEGLRRFTDASGAIACIITDVVMPGMSGQEFLRGVRRAGGEIPVIAMSGYAAGARPEEILGAGFAAYISKPFDLAALTEAVRRALDPPGLPVVH